MRKRAKLRRVVAHLMSKLWSIKIVEIQGVELERRFSCVIHQRFTPFTNYLNPPASKSFRCKMGEFFGKWNAHESSVQKPQNTIKSYKKNWLPANLNAWLKLEEGLSLRMNQMFNGTTTNFRFTTLSLASFYTNSTDTKYKHNNKSHWTTTIWSNKKMNHLGQSPLPILFFLLFCKNSTETRLKNSGSKRKRVMKGCLEFLVANVFQWGKWLIFKFSKHAAKSTKKVIHCKNQQQGSSLQLTINKRSRWLAINGGRRHLILSLWLSHSKSLSSPLK